MGANKADESEDDDVDRSSSDAMVEEWSLGS